MPAYTVPSDSFFSSYPPAYPNSLKTRRERAMRKHAAINLYRSSGHHNLAEKPTEFVPAPLLVGVELNPGPRIPKTVKGMLTPLTNLVADVKKLTQSQPKKPKKSRPQPVQDAPQGPLSNSPEQVASVAYTKRNYVGKPRVKRMNNGDIVVSHREYVADIVSLSGDFRQIQYNINPGNQALFPWLSKTALNYESYNFNKLKFCYETESGSGTAGSVMMGVDYDMHDQPPVSKQELMSYQSSVRSSPWLNCCHTSTSQNLHKQKTYFVQPGVGITNLPTGQVNGALNSTAIQDSLAYVGRLYVATQATPNVVILGELYVEYSIHLMTPVTTVIAFNQVLEYTGSNLNTNAPFNGATKLQNKGNLGIWDDGQNKLYFQTPGTYLIISRIQGAASIPSGPYSHFTFSNCTAQYNFGWANTSGSTGTNSFTNFYLTIPVVTGVTADSRTPQITVDFSSYTGLTDFQFTATQVDPSALLVN